MEYTQLTHIINIIYKCGSKLRRQLQSKLEIYDRGRTLNQERIKRYDNSSRMECYQQLAGRSVMSVIGGNLSRQTIYCNIYNCGRATPLRLRRGTLLLASYSSGTAGCAVPNLYVVCLLVCHI